SVLFPYTTLFRSPAIGGFIGQYSAHFPFIIAAILNAIALIMVIILFPKEQSRPKEIEQDQSKIHEKTTINAPLIHILKPVLLLLMLFFTVQLIGQIPASTWVLFTE